MYIYVFVANPYIKLRVPLSTTHKNQSKALDALL